MKPRLSFLLTTACTALGDRLRGRALATNDDDATFTPFESSRGTESLDSETPISFRNAVVKILPGNERFFTTPELATDIPRGILLNDEVEGDEVGTIRKQVAIFGVYPDTLPGVASGPIPLNAELVADLGTSGYVRALPTTPGTYVVFGRARFAVAAAGDPVSIIHCLPRVVKVV